MFLYKCLLSVTAKRKVRLLNFGKIHMRVTAPALHESVLRFPLVGNLSIDLGHELYYINIDLELGSHNVLMTAECMTQNNFLSLCFLKIELLVQSTWVGQEDRGHIQ